MIVKNLDDMKKSNRNVFWGSGYSRRFLVSSDNMGFSFSDTLIDKGSDYVLKYETHKEACYIIEGQGELHYGNETILLVPGVLYAFDRPIEHRIVAKTKIRMICVFNPPLIGNEVHNFFDDKISGY